MQEGVPVAAFVQQQWLLQLRRLRQHQAPQGMRLLRLVPSVLLNCWCLLLPLMQQRRPQLLLPAAAVTAASRQYLHWCTPNTSSSSSSSVCLCLTRSVSSSSHVELLPLGPQVVDQP